MIFTIFMCDGISFCQICSLNASVAQDFVQNQVRHL